MDGIQTVTTETDGMTVVEMARTPPDQIPSIALLNANQTVQENSAGIMVVGALVAPV